MKVLTTPQARVLAFIRNTAGTGGGFPSIHEVCEHFGFPSVEVAAGQVAVLQQKASLRGSPPPRTGAAELEFPQEMSQQVTVDVPILATVPAEFPEELADSLEGCLTMDIDALGVDPDACTFALRVPDDSLAARHVCRGDTVVCESGLSPMEGDIVAALVDGESVLRVWTRIGGRPELTLPGADDAAVPAEDHLIQGVMVALVRQAD